MPETVDLSSYRNPPHHDKGRGIVVRSIWHIVNAVFLQNSINPSSKLKITIMRMFGAKIGRNVVVKPGINVKHPWFLTVGDNSWIGENAWIDNTYAPIAIGPNVCISQGVYLCTGNHDWTDPAFGLIERSLTIEEGAWIGAQARVLPGASVASHAVVAAGAVLSKSTEPYSIYVGNPASRTKTRSIKSR